MCITRKELDKTVNEIKEYKSIKKDAEKNLKPLEQAVKEYMEETKQTELIGYGFSVSYKEQEKETVIKEKVLELLENPLIKKIIEDEKIDISTLFKITPTKVLRVN